jgi:hypothetical protein
MTALQWIVKEAKAIKKKYPKRFKTWKEYVAQASAIYASKHKGKSPVGKKKATKKAVKKAAPKKKVAKKKIGVVKKKAAPKKAAPKKKVAKKKSVNSKHIDTKSHNVNIKVMSGVKVYGIDQYKKCLSDLDKWEKILKKLEYEKLISPKEYKGAIIRDIKLVKNQIKECKTHSKELKKHI